MRIFQEVFHDFGLHVAQCLLDYRDFNNQESRINTINTVHTLLDNHYIPVINENDTVATEEIMFGDNDKLAALTASLIGAKICMIASDVDGLYTGDPKSERDVNIVPKVSDLDGIVHMVGDSISEQGTGGMKSKIIAAKICLENDVEMWIVNGQKENFALDALNNQIKFTRFVSEPQH
jgi:glutamate 5-kinase